jgi:CRISPR/Cas system CSM-associated protein Csm5 (group 7 of RAMP superfamily)
MSIEELLEKLRTDRDSVEFKEVMQTISDNYDYKPTRFYNGAVVNEAGENEGSCKIFAFARLHDLDAQQTLSCFGKFYREDVLKKPEGTDHANIRDFMACGWGGVEIEGKVLTLKF